MSKPFIPRDYQEVMIDHVLQHPRAALFVFMGAGKSASTLQALDALSFTDDIYPALIMAPLRVARSTWPDETRKWSTFRHMGISPIIGTASERVNALRQPSDIYTVNYENLPWLTQQLGSKWPYRTVIADESIKLKSFRTRQGGTRTAAIREYAHTKVKRWLNLSGAPSPNGLKDLWGQTFFLDQGRRLGRTFTAFEQRWFAYRRITDALDHSGHVQSFALPHAQEEIQSRIKDICLSLNAADYFDIRDPIVTPVYVDLPPAVRKLYRSMEREFFMKIERHEIAAVNAGVKSAKLLQLTSGACYVDPDADGELHPRARDWKVVHNEKLEALDSIVDEACGMPVLVGYNFKSDLARLKKHFPKGRHIDTKRDEDDFKAGKISIGFAHPASLGHGVDGFQYATNICAFFSLDWNLDNYLQFIERIGPVRQLQAGFTRNVFVYLIIARDTIDEDVVERLRTKRSVQDVLLEALNRRRNSTQ